MKVPHADLSIRALRAIVAEFVTRDGTDHSAVDKRVESVLRQLDKGTAELHYDEESETCHIRMANEEAP